MRMIKILLMLSQLWEVNYSSQFISSNYNLIGNIDKSGNINAERLVDIIKNQFKLTIDIEALIKEIDEDGSGYYQRIKHSYYDII